MVSILIRCTVINMYRAPSLYNIIDIKYHILIYRYRYVWYGTLIIFSADQFKWLALKNNIGLYYRYWILITNYLCYSWVEWVALIGEFHADFLQAALLGSSWVRTHLLTAWLTITMAQSVAKLVPVSLSPPLQRSALPMPPGTWIALGNYAKNVEHLLASFLWLLQRHRTSYSQPQQQ